MKNSDKKTFSSMTLVEKRQNLYQWLGFVDILFSGPFWPTSSPFNADFLAICQIFAAKSALNGVTKRSSKTKSQQNLTLLIGFTLLFSFPNMATLYDDVSSLERSMVDEGLKHYELAPENEPANKVVKKIFVITGSPFTEKSGILTILNYMHVNTRESIIRRDLFVREGEPYDEAAVRDSELVLRGAGSVRSLAVIVPVRDRELKNNEIYLLVATRDLLSLRPSINFQGTGGLLTTLMIAVGEHNFLGYNKSIDGIYEMQQGAHVWSARYFDPRLFGTPLQFVIRPSLVFARDTYKFDGFMGDIRLEQPLLSETDRWGYGVDFSQGARTVIDFHGAKVRTYRIESAGKKESFDRKYHWRYTRGSAFGRYSFGTTYKKEVFFGYGLRVKRPSILPDSPLDEAQQEIFKKNVLPRNEKESFITLGFSYFQNKFITLYDYDNYRLQETRRTGPVVSVSNDFASKEVLFSDNNFLRPELRLSFLYSLFEDSFLSLSFGSSNRFDGEWNDNVFKYGITAVSPKIFGIGRLVADGRLTTVYDNRDNQKIALGSDSGIRSVESRFYFGDIGFRTNVELRSVPLDVWIFHVGGAVFYDVGSAFDEWKRANATHGLGFGIRILAPQISSVLFRFDLAFPIYGKGQNYHVVVPSFGTGQAF